MNTGSNPILRKNSFRLLFNLYKENRIGIIIQRSNHHFPISNTQI